jgi:hypothetical protein
MKSIRKQLEAIWANGTNAGSACESYEFVCKLLERKGKRGKAMMDMWNEKNEAVMDTDYSRERDSWRACRRCDFAAITELGF